MRALSSVVLVLSVGSSLTLAAPSPNDGAVLVARANGPPAGPLRASEDPHGIATKTTSIATFGGEDAKREWNVRFCEKGTKTECTKLLQSIAPDAENPAANFFADLRMHIKLVEEATVGWSVKTKKGTFARMKQEIALPDLKAALSALKALTKAALEVYPEFKGLVDPMTELKYDHNPYEKKNREDLEARRNEMYLGRLALDAAVNLNIDWPAKDHREYLAEAERSLKLKYKEMDDAIVLAIRWQPPTVTGKKAGLFSSKRKSPLYFNEAEFDSAIKEIEKVGGSTPTGRRLIQETFSTLYAQYPLVESFIRKHDKFSYTFSNQAGSSHLASITREISEKNYREMMALVGMEDMPRFE